MRITLFVCVLLTSVVHLGAQESGAVHPTVPSVLDRMKSPSWSQREGAFGEAGELLASEKTTPEEVDRLRLGIFQLLIKESNGGLKESENVKAESYGEGYGEDKSEYYAGLIAFVAGLDDERAIPALLSAAGTGGMATRAVARFGKRALAPTLAQAKSQDSDLASGALFVLRDMLEFRLIGETESHLQIKNALRSALASPDSRVRQDAIYIVGYLDDRQEFVPALKNLAERDPYKLVGQHSDDGQDNGQVFPVRRAARLLLGQIANHEKPVVDSGLPPSEYQPANP
jgi:hypothetical protein